VGPARPTSAGMIRIHLQRGRGPAAVYVFETDSVVIGRGGGEQAVALRLPFADVSRAQCRVRVRGEQVTVEELSSSGGTFLRATGARIRGEVRVGPEDELRFGACSMRVSGASPAAQVQARAPESAAGRAPESAAGRAPEVIARAPEGVAGGGGGVAGAVVAGARGVGWRVIGAVVRVWPLWIGLVGVSAGLFAGGIASPWIAALEAVEGEPASVLMMAPEVGVGTGIEEGQGRVIGVIPELRGIDAIGGGGSALVSAAGGRWILDGERETLRKIMEIGGARGPWAAAPGWLVEASGRADAMGLWRLGVDGAARVSELRSDAVIRAVGISPGGQRIAALGAGWIELWEGCVGRERSERGCGGRLARGRIEGVGGAVAVSVSDEGTAVALVGHEAWVLRGDGGSARRLGEQVTAAVVLKDGRVVIGDRRGEMLLWARRGRRWRSERVSGLGGAIVGLLEGPGGEQVVALDEGGGIHRVDLGARWRRDGEALRVRLGAIGGAARGWALTRGGWLGVIDREEGLWVVDAGRSASGEARRTDVGCVVVGGAGEALWCGRPDGGIVRVDLGR
jgi:hypothetical protein